MASEIAPSPPPIVAPPPPLPLAAPPAIVAPAVPALPPVAAARIATPAESPPLAASSAHASPPAPPFSDEALPAARPAAPAFTRGGSYPFGGYASGQAARPLGEVVADEFAQAGPDGKVDLKALGRKAAEIAEREAIVAMLARTGGSKREAAVRLGISYKAILYKIREFGIGRPRTPRKAVVESPLPAESSALVDLDEDLDDEFGEEEVAR